MNYNVATQTNFKLEIANADEFNFFVQTTSLPSINVADIPTPWQNNGVNVPDNRIEYDPLNVTFLVSEDYSNYRFLQRWIMMVRNNTLEDLFQDMTLHILNNNKLTVMTVVFYYGYPTMIGEIPLESGVVETTPIFCNVTFRYQYFEITSYANRRD